jgi:hypothetical protein
MRLSELLTMLAVAAGGAALGGCSSSGTLARYTHDSPEAARQAGIYLDGTGPSAESAVRAQNRPQPAQPVKRAQARPVQPAQDVSARTTGSRPAQSEPLKPYSDEWWERENREDARLRQKMNICRGC